MSRIYSSTNRIKFTDIPEKYSIPRSFKAKQAEGHSAVVTYVFEHYKDTKKYRQKIVDALNSLTYCILQEEPPAYSWSRTDPLDTLPEMDMDLVESTLGAFYLTPDAIEWDVSPTDNMISVDVDVKSEQAAIDSSAQQEKVGSTKIASKLKVESHTSTTDQKISNRPLHQIKEQQKATNKNSFVPTPKEDLYIQPPKCPRFDANKIWMSAVVGGDNLTIYTTLPEIPTRQNEISVTTNPDQMTSSELMALYPNHIIHTRAQVMYQEYDGLEYDDDLGCIIPVEGFTHDQLVDNIIRYPHLYRLRKIGPNGAIQKFFSTLEIDGELVPVSDIWDSLPESKIIPRDPEFVKEYVIRRYLLERENGVQHTYQMFGTLDPFLTLFMPYTNYIERGYTDTLSIVKQCVTSRIHYKQSRSPILRRMETQSV